MRSEHSKLLAVSKGECKGNVIPLTSNENTVLQNKHKDFAFFLENNNKVVIMENWWNTRNF